MANRTQRIVDTLLYLRDVTAGAETSTAAETGIAFDCRKVDQYKAVFNVTAVDGTTGDETVTLSIGVSDQVGGTYTTIATTPALAGSTWDSAVPFTVELPLNGSVAETLDADSDFIQCKATLAGTSPSVTYGCFLTKV